MAIAHGDISPTDEDLGRRVLVVARSIAPCIDDLVDEARLDAIAVLKAVVASTPVPGQRGIASQRIGSASVTYRQISDAFDSEARASLRLICGVETLPGLPVGSFPAPGLVGDVWPETVL